MDKTEFFEDKVVENGVTLPVLNYKGRPYLTAASRITWFRAKHGTKGIIKTQMLDHQNETCVFRAEVYIDDKLVSSGHKMSAKKLNNFDYLATAETGSISRALGLAGFNLMNDPDLDEGDELADSPLALPKTLQPKNKEVIVATNSEVVTPEVVTGTEEAKVARPSFRRKIAEAKGTTDDL